MKYVTSNGRHRGPAVLLLALVAGLGVGATASVALSTAVSAPPHKNAIRLDSTPVSNYPVNQNGQTYGSSLGVASPSSEPDLIEAESNGVVGYVLASELNAADGANVSTPQQAAEWDATGATTTHTIPLYAPNGISIIGSYTVTPGSGTETLSTGASAPIK